jgi:hypothetical protein
MAKLDPHLIGENTLVYDEDSLWITDATVSATQSITIDDSAWNYGRIHIDLSGVSCDGFVFSYGGANQHELSIAELESLLNLRNEEVRLREENSTVKDAWRKYCVALKLARNSDTDK